jgi:hypothetical protein
MAIPDSPATEGVRFEIPSRYAHIQKLCGRYASWDLRSVHLADRLTPPMRGLW